MFSFEEVTRFIHTYLQLAAAIYIIIQIVLYEDNENVYTQT